MWEVPDNQKGGRWLINVRLLTPLHQLYIQIEKTRPIEVMDIIWLEILIAMIGEQFGEDMEQICGLVANVRNKGSKVRVLTGCGREMSEGMRLCLTL